MKFKLTKLGTLTLVVGLMMALGNVQHASAACQLPPQESSQPTYSSLTDGQKAWLELLPAMKEYHDKRFEVYIDHINEVRRIVRETAGAVNIQPFVGELMGLEALFTSASSQQDVEAYISEKLTSMVVDSDVLIAEIQKVYDSFAAENQAITNRFLVANNLDIDLDPRSIEMDQVDTSELRAQLQRQEEALTERLYTASQERLLAAGAGMMAGGLGHSLGHELGKDQNGEATWMSTLLGLAGAAATEMLAEEAALNVMETRTKLHNATDQAVASILRPLTGNGNELDGCDLELQKMFVDHQSLLLTGLANHLGVDADWANQNLPK